jgi:hypothetical protein
MPEGVAIRAGASSRLCLPQDERQALAECVQHALAEVQAQATKASAEAAAGEGGKGGAPDQVDVEAVLQAQLEERRKAEARAHTPMRLIEAPENPGEP